MIYAVWLFPTFLIGVAIIRGWGKSSHSALLGALASIPIALFAAPEEFEFSHLLEALSRGAWIGGIITPYIFGGLLFWQIAASNKRVEPFSLGAKSAPERSPMARRRQLFFACFLVGPFAEAATGFGIGMLATVAILRPLQLRPACLMVFALMSQTLIPWGAMGSGTLLAATYARLSAVELGIHSLMLVSVLMACIWLPLYWLTARAAGFEGTVQTHLGEAVWVAVALCVLGVATNYLGPEVAMLASYGPLIAIHYFYSNSLNAGRVKTAASRALPYVVMIGALVSIRIFPVVKDGLTSSVKFSPYGDLPSWFPLAHPGTWLIAGALICVVLKRRFMDVRYELRTAWSTGSQAVFTVFFFGMMSEVMSISGISQACAQGLFDALNANALILTPLISGAFGILANSGNASSSLFMSSQATLAQQAGLSVAAVAALQHVSGSSLAIFSPVRMSIAATLCDGNGKQREVYVRLLPFAVASFAILTLAAIFVTSQ